MKNKLARIHGFNFVAAAITKQMHHDFNLTNQDMPQLKREVSCAEMLRKLKYLQIRYIAVQTKACA